MGECKYCGTVHPEGEIANPHYCIARLCEQLEEKDKEIERLRAEMAGRGFVRYPAHTSNQSTPPQEDSDD